MTKPFYLSTTIISSIVSVIAQLLGAFHINIADLIPIITDAVGQEINATIAVIGAVGAIYGRCVAKTAITLGSTPPAASTSLLVLAAVCGVGALSLIGCSSSSTSINNGAPAALPSKLQTVVTATLKAIQATSSSLAAQGVVPAGKPADVVNDASTISNAFQTVNTGQGLTQSQALAIAQSFHSNASTTGYIQLGASLSNIIVPFVNSLIQQGFPASQVQAATNSVLVNAPGAVQAGITTAPVANP